MSDWEVRNILEIENEFIEAVARGKRPPPEIRRGMEEIKRNTESLFFSEVIYGIAGLRFEEEEARRHWRSIMEHNRSVSKRIGRNPGVHVSALDYFKNIRKETLSSASRLPKNNHDSEEKGTAKNGNGNGSAVRFSVVDGLTGLYNHRYFHEALAHFVQAGRRWGQSFSVFLFDVDRFKDYNEEHGHLAGDVALSEMGQLIMPLIRNGLDVACRYEGDAFAILFPGTTRATAAKVAERIRAVTAFHPFSCGDVGFREGSITLSGGITTFPVDGDEKDRLMVKAEQLMHQAKFEGRNRVLCGSFLPAEETVN